ncbi:Nn.00g086520.m01.CDS01 [Neocucurbitaria sp. VM-36]
MELNPLENVLLRLSPIFLLAAAYILIGRIRDYRRLRHFGGPATTGISWWWHSKAVLSGRAHEYYGQVTEKYGPIARVAPNHLVTSDPDFWAKMNAVRSPYRRAPWYYHAARFEPGKDNVFTDCDNDSHDARRKKMASGYSGKENPTLEPSIDTHVKELIELVRKYAAPASSARTSTPMDLAKKIPFFTLDVISHVGLGEPFGNLKADEDLKDYLKSSEEGLKIANTAFAMGIAWLREVPIIGAAISPSEKDVSGFGRMMAEARRIIDARKARSMEGKSDMLASFTKNGVSGEDLFQEVFEQILAGSDTTAAAIRITLLYIISHPRVYTKLQAEIDGAVRSGIGSSGVISDVEARGLPYLVAVVREGLRVHPPVVNLFSRIAPDEGDVVTIDQKEYHIPGGTMVGYAAWTMHRDNRSIYGDDTHVFRPERWLIDESVPEEKERLIKMTKTNDMIFGYGRWRCLGRTIALIEIHKCIFELLRNFDLALTNPHEPWGVYNSMGLWEIRDIAPLQPTYPAFPAQLHPAGAPTDHDGPSYEPEEHQTSDLRQTGLNHDKQIKDDRSTLKQLLSGSQHAPAPPLMRNAAPPGQFDMRPPPNSTHTSWQTLHDYAQSHASEHGYALSINTTAKNRSRIKLACVCYGQPKNTHKLTPETRVRKNRVSYKTGCKMWIEGKRAEDGTWVLRVGEPGHNHPGRASEGWALQRKRTWGVVGGRVGIGGVTAKEELARRSNASSKDFREGRADEDEGNDEDCGQQQEPSHSLERGGLVWEIVEQEMLRKGEPNQGRDRGVGRTVEVLQAQLPGIHIFKRDVYNIRAQIKRARKVTGQKVGEGLNENDDKESVAGPEEEVDVSYPEQQRPQPSSQHYQNIPQRSEPVITANHDCPHIDPLLGTQMSTEIGSTSAQTQSERFEAEQLRQENVDLRRLLVERTKELKEKALEIATLRSQVEYMTNMVLAR